MKLKSFVFAGALAASIAAPAFANETPVAAPLPQFSMTDTHMLFEQNAKPMQLAALSQQEMKETEGAWINFAIGAGTGLGMYAAQSWYFNQPMTWRGAGVAAASGALTGGIGAAAIKASGGAVAGGALAANIAWRPNQIAANYSLNRIFGGRR